MLWLTETRARADGLGTVGNWHIGLLARILFVFLLDESTRPKPAAMKTWVDVINWVKREVRSRVLLMRTTLADARFAGLGRIVVRPDLLHVRVQRLLVT